MEVIRKSKHIIFLPDFKEVIELDKTERENLIQLISKVIEWSI